MEYIDALDQGEAGCFLCRHRDAPDKDAENFVLWRGPNSFAMLNRYPYAGGHSLIAPYAHVGDLGEVATAVLVEMMQQVRDLKQLLSHAIRAQGFNIGINLGRCAGAGLPDHLHIHVVPRWEGDTNFMPMLGKVRVIPQALSELHAQLTAAAREMNLPAFGS